MKKVTVLYHNDADGFGAAYAFWTVFGDEATYTPVQYGQPVPEIPGGTTDLYIVDFSYDRQTCEELAKYNLTILDHHKTAEKELEGLAFAHFDMNRSGAVMAWDYFWPTVPVPEILQYVQDRDLWRFDLPKSEEINLFIATLPFDFAVWDIYARGDDHFRDIAELSGEAIRDFRDQQIEGRLRDVRWMSLAGHEAPVVCCSDNISEVGNALCEKYPDASFSVSYCDRKDARSWSLRSKGEFDVSAVAKQFGGGGHRNAAGFSTPIGWPEQPSEEFLTVTAELLK